MLTLRLIEFQQYSSLKKRLKCSSLVLDTLPPTPRALFCFCTRRVFFFFLCALRPEEKPNHGKVPQHQKAPLRHWFRHNTCAIVRNRSVRSVDIIYSRFRGRRVKKRIYSSLATFSFGLVKSLASSGSAFKWLKLIRIGDFRKVEGRTPFL